MYGNNKTQSKIIKKNNASSSSSNTSNSKNKPNNNKENEKRSCELLSLLYKEIDKTKFDPILQTFQSNEMLKEFYMKRIFEILNTATPGLYSVVF